MMPSLGEQEKVIAPAPAVLSPEQVLSGKIKKTFLTEPHRAYGVDDLLRALKMLSPKDPEKQAKASEQVQVNLAVLLQEGVIREVGPALFKTRLFFDAEKNIEHAYIGGMGNASYAFYAPIFRLNIGVLSLFFMKNDKTGCFRVCVSDTTIGRNYCLFRPLGDGIHIFGTSPEQSEGKTSWVIDGKYIDKTHVSITLSPSRIDVVDYRTIRGTRVDHLTDAGYSYYTQGAESFLKATDRAGVKDIVRRGRFVLEQLLHHHKDFEASFFSVAVDSVLLQEAD